MSTGQAIPKSVPEVPDEFAAAYREAYERALRDQTDAPRHRQPAQYRPGYVEPELARAPFETGAARPPQGPGRGSIVSANVDSADVNLPERQGRLVVDTHRADALDVEDTWYDHVLDSRMFVPVMLMALAAMLVLGAYVLGRVFIAVVSG